MNKAKRPSAWLEVRQNDDEAFASCYRIDIVDEEQDLRRIELVATLHEAADGRVRAARLPAISAKTNKRVTFKDIYSASSRMATEAGVPMEVVIKDNVQFGR